MILDRALWITWYDLPADGCGAYLSWLHETYIPKLLRKPGFLWAAHYSSIKQTISPGYQKRVHFTKDSTVPTGNDHILLVGGEDVRVFANPVPRELRAELPAEDKTMFSMRIGERTNIFVEHARIDGPAADQRECGMALGPCIQLGSFNTSTYKQEDELLDWYVHSRMPGVQKLPGFIGGRNLVSVSGWAKHGALYEFVSLAARNEQFPDFEKPNSGAAAWRDKIVPTLVHAPGSPTVACRS